MEIVLEVIPYALLLALGLVCGIIWLIFVPMWISQIRRNSYYTMKAMEYMAYDDKQVGYEGPAPVADPRARKMPKMVGKATTVAALQHLKD